MKPSQQWIEDSTKWRGKVLRGPDAHWCMDWDALPVSAFTVEYSCCHEKKSLLGRVCNWFYMRYYNYTCDVQRMKYETVADRENFSTPLRRLLIYSCTNKELGL